MPNWATTDYVISNANKDEKRLNELKDYLLSLFDVEDGVFETDFRNGKSWLGNVVYSSLLKQGVDEPTAREKAIARNEYNCRGVLNDEIILEDGKITFSTDSAWYYPEGVFELALEAGGFEDFEMFWLCIEPGCEIFSTNDSEGECFPASYCFDLYLDSNDKTLGEKLSKIGLEEDFLLLEEEEAKEIFSKLLTSELVDEEYRLTEEKVENLSTEEMFEILSDDILIDDVCLSLHLIEVVE